MRREDEESQSEDLTVEEARTFECCKDLTDEQIKELLDTIRTFTEIAYSIFAKKQAERENQEDTNYEIAA